MQYQVPNLVPNQPTKRLWKLTLPVYRGPQWPLVIMSLLLALIRRAGIVRPS
jgi:hypothetical protein